MPNPAHDARGRFAKKSQTHTVSKAQGWATLSELGRSSKPSAQLFPDFIPQLSGVRAIRTYREMAENDATVGSILFAVEMLLRRMTWEDVPYDDTPQAEEAATFLGECRQDMSHTWPDHMAAITTMLTYGFSPFEIVYRQRTPAGGSRFSDGRVGWRRFGYRPQDTLVCWLYDDDGGLAGMRQQIGSTTVDIPIDKMLLYQVRPGMGQPESRSMLRTAYRPWWAKKRAEELTLIGFERTAVGLPVLRIPAESIVAGDALFTRAKEMAQRIRNDDQMGIVWPSDRDEQGNPLYDVGFMPMPGTPPVNGIELIRHFSADIAASVLADFLSLGRDATGSRALADPKQELFQQALTAWADSVEEVQNRFAIPRLFALNDFDPERLPTLRHGPIEKVDLAELGQFVLQLAQAGHDWGFLTEGDPIRDQVRQLAGFDPEPEVQKRLPMRFDA